MMRRMATRSISRFTRRLARRCTSRGKCGRGGRVATRRASGAQRLLRSGDGSRSRWGSRGLTGRMRSGVKRRMESWVKRRMETWSIGRFAGGLTGRSTGRR